MSAYLLPCSCGRQTAVSAAQAGQSVRCACGAALDVPNMRRLRLLERPDSSVPAKSTWGAMAWNDRHRVAFLLALVALGGMAVAGYLAAQIPATVVAKVDSPEDFDALWKTATPGEVVEVFQDLKTGLKSPTAADESHAAGRKVLTWGIGLALGTSALALVCAAAVLNLGRRPRP